MFLTILIFILPKGIKFLINIKRWNQPFALTICLPPTTIYVYVFSDEDDFISLHGEHLPQPDG
jgi:hypothetical protein